jgi:hypothetical protein
MDLEEEEKNEREHGLVKGKDISTKSLGFGKGR